MLNDYLKRKKELESKIRSNKDWLRNNIFKIDKQTRRDCNYNIYRDEQELKKIDEAIKDISG